MTVQDELGQRGYQYKHGDRPLDGFTIERAAGRGGFGEVYYAHSDSGREVALKVVNTYEQVELRGISQCMNLKNPHLVTIFDVKYGSDGRPWVIMEYVAGPSLREILDAAPSGLGTAKAAFFLREVGKGLTYLHDCGIVHRDLKPGNIFYENGYVKIGDYGLSKAMSMTRHSGQTVAVGTLHYMAPEIGEGRYDRSIDIYALGALLYEMLTGQVPFLGSSPAEVLMKHLRTEVNLDGLEEPFKSVIRKAMAKNPDERYRSVQEMVEAIFGSEAVRDSVSQFSPATLSMMAGQAARKIGADAAASAAATIPGPDDFADLKERLREGKERWREGRKRMKLRMKLGMKGLWRREGVVLERDRLNWAVRGTMAIGAALLTAVAAASISGDRNLDGVGIFWTIIGATAGAMIAWMLIGRSVEQESRWVQQLAMGTPVALAAWPFSYAITRRHWDNAVFATCAAMLLICWSRRLSPWRKERVSVGDAFTAGICGFLTAMFFGTSAFGPIAVAVGASLAVGLFSPWGKVVEAAAGAAPPPRGPGVVPPPVPPPAANAGGVQPPPIPPAGNPFGVFNDVFQKTWTPQKDGLAPNTHGLPAWAIVAIVLGTVGIVFGSVFHQPFFLSPLGIIVLIIAIQKWQRGAGLKPGFNGGFGGGAGSGAGLTASGRSSIGEVASSAAHGLIATVGGIFLVASMILAAVVVADAPGFLQSALVPKYVPAHIGDALGSDWPHLLRVFGIVGCVVLGWIALLLTLLGRRRGGGFHMFRAVLGIGILFSAIVSLRRGLPSWDTIVPRSNTPAEILDAYVQHIDVHYAIVSGVIFLAGWFLLVWQGRRKEIGMAAVPPVAAVGPAADGKEGKEGK